MKSLYVIRRNYTRCFLETSEFLKKMRKRVIRNFLDVLVLAELRKSAMSGYDVMAFILNKYRFLVSSGTIYSILFSLERNGLISGISIERKRVYKLTEKGEEAIRAITNTNDKIWYLILSLLKVEKQLRSQ